MPGTIHVSVLELVGLPSPQQSSSMFIKVSMGKQAHEMRDKEETSFPLTTLRDNLNVSIQDAEGNEVAHTSVETRSIVQKVMWDDLFPLKGGGNIHMRLQFILTEDEQNRIRSMRESATRIKHEDLMKRRHSSTDTAGASGGSPESSHDSFKSQYKTEGRSVEFSGSQANKISAESNVKSLNKARPDQEFSTSKSTGSPKLLAFQHSNGRFEGQSAEQQNQLDKTPSNAFESSPVKEESSGTNEASATTQLSTSTIVDIPPKPPSLKETVVVNTQSEFSKLEALSSPEEVGKERKKLLSVMETAEVSSNSTVDALPKVLNLKKMVVLDTKPVLSKLEESLAPSTSEEKENEREDLLHPTNTTKESARLRSSARVDTSSNVPILKTDTVNSEIPDQKYTSMTKPTKEEYREKKSPKQLHISPVADRNMLFLKNSLEVLPRRKRFPNDLLTGKERIATSDALANEKKWRSKQWKSSQHRAKLKVSHENEHYANDNWMFLDETISSCVLSDDRPLEDLQEGCLSKCNRDDDQEKLTDTDIVLSKSQEKSNNSNEWESSRRRPSNISFPGPAWQAVKIAIVVGFGLLVLLTRQKK